MRNSLLSLKPLALWNWKHMNFYFSVCVLVIEGYGWHGIEFHLSVGIVSKVGARFIYSSLSSFLMCLLVFSVILT